MAVPQTNALAVARAFPQVSTAAQDVARLRPETAIPRPVGPCTPVAWASSRINARPAAFRQRKDLCGRSAIAFHGQEALGNDQFAATPGCVISQGGFGKWRRPRRAFNRGASAHDAAVLAATFRVAMFSAASVVALVVMSLV